MEIQGDVGAVDAQHIAPAGERLLEAIDQVPGDIRAEWHIVADALVSMGPAAEDFAAGRISKNQFNERFDAKVQEPEVVAANLAVNEAVFRDCSDLVPPATFPATSFETAMFCDRFSTAKYGEDYQEVAGPTSTMVERTPDDAVTYYRSINMLVPADLQDQVAAILTLHTAIAAGQTLSETERSAADGAKEELADWLHANCDLEYGIDEL